MRIIRDGSCEIGENDRTAVHISGEKSVPKETEDEENILPKTLFANQEISPATADNGEWERSTIT